MEYQKIINLLGNTNTRNQPPNSGQKMGFK